jgi:hypothetical protein
MSKDSDNVDADDVEQDEVNFWPMRTTAAREISASG